MKKFNRDLTKKEAKEWSSIVMWRGVDNLKFIKLQAKFIKKLL